MSCLTLLSDKFIFDSGFKSQVKYINKTFQPNEKIVTAGNSSPYFYFITKGSVRVIATQGHQKNADAIGRHIVINVNKGEIFGEESLFDDVPSITDIEAITETEVVEIDNKSFLKFLESDKKIGFAIYSEILQKSFSRITQLNKTIFQLFELTRQKV